MTAAGRKLLPLDAESVDEPPTGTTDRPGV